MVLIDYHSKWVEFEVTNSPSTLTVMAFLARIFNSEGNPKELVTDNCTHFSSTKMKEFLTSRQIKHLRVALYSSSSSGLVERMNRFLKEGIQSALACNEVVDEFLCKKIWAYLTTPHSITGISPFRLLRKRDAGGKVFPDWLRELNVNNNACVSCHDKEKLQNKILTQQSLQKKYFDSKFKLRQQDFSIGDWVLVKKPMKVKKGASRFSLSVQVLKVSKGSVFLDKKG